LCGCTTVTVSLQSLTCCFCLVRSDYCCHRHRLGRSGCDSTSAIVPRHSVTVVHDCCCVDNGKQSRCCAQLHICATTLLLLLILFSSLVLCNRIFFEALRIGACGRGCAVPAASELKAESSTSKALQRLHSRNMFSTHNDLIPPPC